MWIWKEMEIIILEGKVRNVEVLKSIGEDRRILKKQ